MENLLVYKEANGDFWAFAKHPWGAAHLSTISKVLHTGYLAKTERLVDDDEFSLWEKVADVDLDFSKAKQTRLALLDIMAGKEVERSTFSLPQPIDDENFFLNIWD